jgi:hypothetical protein
LIANLSNYVPFESVSDNDLLRARIFNKCRLSESGCWLWMGPKRAGYGVFYAGGDDRSAHRIAYEVFIGPIPTGLHLLHSCDNPGCINPGHLRPGTVKENMADRDARKRRDVRGQQIGTSKLTDDEVRAIKASPDVSQKVLAEKYGVAPTHIWRIRAGKSWAHIVALETVNGR